MLFGELKLTLFARITDIWWVPAPSTPRAGGVRLICANFIAICIKKQQVVASWARHTQPLRLDVWYVGVCNLLEASCASTSIEQATAEAQSNCLQGLGALPNELLIQILRGSDAPPLAKQLRLLPSTLHTAAMHAAFPSIAADRSFCVDTSDLAKAAFDPFAEALWPAIARITSFRRTHKDWGFGAPPLADITALGSQLVKLSCIQDLHLGGNLLYAQGTRVLGPHLAQLTSIQQLDLSSNYIGASGAEALGPHLAHLTSLRQLSLRENFIGPDGAKALGPHLAHLTQLRQLDLNHNILGPRGAAALGRHLARLTSIQQLDLGRNEIGADGNNSLRSHLAPLTSIQKLNLR